MEVIHLSAECYPVAKVGGLADVVGSLPKFQRKLGIEASVVMPFYEKPFLHQNEFEFLVEDRFYQGSELLTYIVIKEKTDKLGFPLYLIKIPGKLDRPEVYGYRDEADQWIAFQHAFLHWMKYHYGKTPDIVHCHDHHMGLIPFFMKFSYEFGSFYNVRTVFTVHNGQYQGWMPWSKAGAFPGYDSWKWGLLDWNGLINPMATAIKCSDAYTAVSEGYLGELFYNARGLQDLFSAERGKAVGIVNGIDDTYWNPATDEMVAKKYTVKTVNQGKKDNKKAICEKFNLRDDLPLISFIGRFAEEKGADLLFEIISKMFWEHNDRFVFIVLGSGNAHIEWQINSLAGIHPGYMGVYIGYNEALAHEIYAASDMLLMPSRVEPCGLNQLYAMKYGTVPVVRSIGGLRDTVVDVDESEEGYGFKFNNADAPGAVWAMQRGVEYYEKKRNWSIIRSRAMRLDFSWDKSAQKYIDLYEKLLS